MTRQQLDQARRLLCSMQDTIRDAILRSRDKEAARFSKVAAVTEADTIYYVDRVSEEAITGWFESNWPRKWPVELVMEGLEEDSEARFFPRGTTPGKVLFKCIIDPIDGTRGFMYDKRSAWILTGLAPHHGSKTELSDIVVAAMTELPTSKQWRSDQLSAIRGGPLHATGQDLRSGKRKKLRLSPSQAKDYRHGFASIARFFPEGKELLSRFEEALWAKLLGIGQGKSPLVFDDQYISTGGQLYELIAGHDRMIADLRPLAFAKLGLPKELVCHPYDICVALLLEAAGGVVESPQGGQLRIPLNTTAPVAWVGYANPHLAKATRPVMKRLCREHLGN